jgi:uncharacterized lipoprotein YddW (UPF0748 family)
MSGGVSRRDFVHRCFAASAFVAHGPWLGGLSTGRGAALPPPAPEIRAAWLSLFDPFDLFAETERPERGPSTAGVQQVFDILGAVGFNTVFVMVDSWYAYSIVHPDYQPKKSLAEWDAFGEVLRAASQRGITVHLSFPLVNDRGYPQGTHQPPDFTVASGGNPAWRARYLAADGELSDSRSNVCPSRPETRAWEARLLRELLERYPEVTQVQLEEPGYDTPVHCVCDECRRQYASRYGGDLVAQVQQEAAVEHCPDSDCAGQAAVLKCEHLTHLLQAVREELVGRAITWSATISYDPWRDRRLGRDWVRWANLGWLDFVAPMIYTRTDAVFRDSLEAGVLSHLPLLCHVCPGIGVHFGGALLPEGGRPAPDINSVVEVVRQIGAACEVARNTGRVNGVALFLGELLRPAYRSLGAGCLRAISSQAFHA